MNITFKINIRMFQIFVRVHRWARLLRRWWRPQLPRLCQLRCAPSPASQRPLHLASKCRGQIRRASSTGRLLCPPWLRATSETVSLMSPSRGIYVGRPQLRIQPHRPPSYAGFATNNLLRLSFHNRLPIATTRVAPSRPIKDRRKAKYSAGWQEAFSQV